MVVITILEQNKDFLIKEVNYKKPYFNRKFRGKIEIIAYFNEDYRKSEGEIIVK
ncbi:MAG: hypothetical protein ACFFA0_06340 [Promethearchaeota archaeon]